MKEASQWDKYQAVEEARNSTLEDQWVTMTSNLTQVWSTIKSIKTGRSRINSSFSTDKTQCRPRCSNATQWLSRAHKVLMMRCNSLCLEIRTKTIIKCSNQWFKTITMVVQIIKCKEITCTTTIWDPSKTNLTDISNQIWTCTISNSGNRISCWTSSSSKWIRRQIKWIWVQAMREEIFNNSKLPRSNPVNYHNQMHRLSIQVNKPINQMPTITQHPRRLVRHCIQMQLLKVKMMSPFQVRLPKH